MDLSNKTLFVTAGAHGMGRRFAEYVCANGGRVAIADKDWDAARALADTLPTAIAIGCDVSRVDQVEAAKDAAIGQFGQIDLVLSHAGITKAGPLSGFSDADWQEIFDVNVFGMARVVRAFASHFTERGGGHFILTSSSLALIAGHPLSALAAPYVASKAAVIALAQSAAVALNKSGIGVTLFAPDLTDTGFAKAPAGSETQVPASAVLNTSRQTVDDAIRVLVEALEEDRFLASATPGFAQQLSRQAQALLDPLTLTHS